MSRYFGVVLWLVGFFGMFLMVVQPAWGYTMYFVNAVVWFLLLVIVPVEVNRILRPCVFRFFSRYRL